MKDDRLLEMRVFEAVVEAGGFTAAAHALGLSQPFVSQARGHGGLSGGGGTSAEQ